MNKTKQKISEGFIIRKARPDDAKEISKLVVENILKVKENNYTPAQTKAWLEINTSEEMKEYLGQTDMFVLTSADEKRILSTIALANKDVIEMVYTAHDQIGNGLGSILLSFIEVIAIENKVKKLNLVSTPFAKPFYLSKGFKVIGAKNIPYGKEYFFEYEMEKKL